MGTLTHAGRSWPVDEKGFLAGFDLWDEGFAEACAPAAGITGPLDEERLKVLRYIRRESAKTGRCPTVYMACRDTGTPLERMRSLFPAGYLRGACRLAGVSYREGYLTGGPAETGDKFYTVDVRGFLIDPAEWDESYALHKAREMGIETGLTEQHWRVLRFLRERWAETGEVPTVYDTCEQNRISLWDLERLFPQGYHRGAVKIAGLRVR